MNTSATGPTLRSAAAKNVRGAPAFVAVSGAVANTGVVGQIPTGPVAAGGHAPVTATRPAVLEDATGESSSSPRDVQLPSSEYSPDSIEHDSDEQEHDSESPRAPTTTPADAHTSNTIHHPIQNDPMLADEGRRPSPPPSKTSRSSRSWPSRQPEGSKQARRSSKMTGSGSKSAKTPMRRNISS